MYETIALRIDGRRSSGSTSAPWAVRFANVAGGVRLEDRLAPATLADLFAGTAVFDAAGATDKTNTGLIGGTTDPGLHNVNFARTGPSSYARTSSGDYYVYYNYTFPDSDTLHARQDGVGLAMLDDDGVTVLSRQVVVTPAAIGTPGVLNNKYDSFPSVWVDSGIWYMVTEGAQTGENPRILLRTSSNGISWTAPSVILSYNPSSLYSGWDSGGVGTPSLSKAGDQWYLYYHGARTMDFSTGLLHFSIGMATGTSLTSLQRTPGQTPTIPIGQGLSGLFDAQYGDRSILKEGDYYYMLFETGAADNKNWSSTIARSTDQINWTLIGGNVLPTSKQVYAPGATQTFGFDNAELFKADDNNIYIYYRAQDDVTKSNLGSYTRRAQLVATPAVANQTLESESNFYHQIGAAQGDGWAASVAGGMGYLSYGPYWGIPGEGRRTARFKLQVDDITANNAKVVRIEVHDSTSQSVIASREITRQEFLAINSYQTFDLDFYASNQPTQHALEYRTWYYATSYVRQDNVVLMMPPTVNAANEYEAESELNHQTGNAFMGGWDAAAWNGSTPNAYMAYGPFHSVDVGYRFATFRLMVDNTTANNDAVAVIDIRDHTTNQVVRTMTLTRQMFNFDYIYQDFDLPFVGEAGHAYEWRVQWTGNSYVRHDKTTIR